MFKSILVYGVIAGLIVGTPSFIGPFTMQHGHKPLAISMLIGYATMLVALSFVFVAVKRYRDTAGGGVIKFFPALGMGLAISVIAGIFYVAAWEAASAITHLDFADGYARVYIAEQKAKGISPEALAKITAQMEAFKVQYANPFYRTFMTFTEIFPIGVLASLITAALLRNPRFFPARAN